MAKKRDRKFKSKSHSESVGFKYCGHCGSRRKINGTCQICGATDKAKDKESVSNKKKVEDRTAENGTG